MEGLRSLGKLVKLAFSMYLGTPIEDTSLRGVSPGENRFVLARGPRGKLERIHGSTLLSSRWLTPRTLYREWGLQCGKEPSPLWPKPQ